jgi:hypothetical protein
MIKYYRVEDAYEHKEQDNYSGNMRTAGGRRAGGGAVL